MTINIESDIMKRIEEEARELNIDPKRLVEMKVNSLFMDAKLDALQKDLEVYAKRLGITTEEQIFEMVS